MSFKDILAIVTSPKQEAVLQAVEALQTQFAAHVAVLHLAQLPDPPSAEFTFTGDIWARMVEDARAAQAEARTALDARLRNGTPPIEVRLADALIGGVSLVVGVQALHADVTVMQRPETEFEMEAFEAALFRSGRPVLLLPPEWRAGAIGRRVALAWQPKREAARALADAAPFVSTAEKVSVLTVDATPNGYGQGPGQDIAVHVARRCRTVDLRNIDGMGRPPETALVEEAKAIGADLIVLGGYGHSRLTEFVFGGVTRSLVKTSPLPLLLSH